MKHPDARIEAVLNALAPTKLPTIDLTLDRVSALMEALGNPQDSLPPVVHVAGTNGKGSFLAYLTAILREAGYTMHRYTSPHLVRFNERIMLAGKEIEDAYLLALLQHIQSLTEKHPVTFFEATTAAAFHAFAESSADIVLLETGLGGRLDATNLVRTPMLTAITPISMDHTEFLGNTLASIAREKAGILKAGVPCVVGPQPAEAMAEIEKAAGNIGAPLLRYGQEWNVNARYPMPNLPGAHQVINAATAAACAKRLPEFCVTDAHIAQGITHAQWPARLQRLKEGSLAALAKNNELWLDGGHNPSAGEALGAWAKAQVKPVHVICAMLKNKDSEGFLKPLSPHVQSFTAIAIPEEHLSQDPAALCATATTLGMKNRLGTDVKNSIEHIVKEEKNNSIILICGSLYLAGYILWQNGQAA